MDKPAGAKTRVEFVNRFQEKPVLVIGSHFADPGAGYIVRTRRCLETALAGLRSAPLGQAIPEYPVDLFSHESVRNARAR